MPACPQGEGSGWYDDFTYCKDCHVLKAKGTLTSQCTTCAVVAGGTDLYNSSGASEVSSTCYVTCMISFIGLPHFIVQR